MAATPQQDTTRVAPSPHIAVAVLLGYLALVGIVWAGNGFDYLTVADTTDNVVAGIVVPVGLGAVYLAVVATALGWWRPAIVETRRTAPRWMLVVPALQLVIALIGVSTISFGADAGPALGMLALGTLLIGFSEEMATRGLLLVGLRSRMTERAVWLVSAALFALLHAMNAFFGQSLAETSLQIVIAALAGTVFYVTRIATGTLVVPMLLHATWDFGVLGTQGTGGDPNPAGGLLNWVVVVVAIVAAVRITRPEHAAAVEVQPAS